MQNLGVTPSDASPRRFFLKYLLTISSLLSVGGCASLSLKTKTAKIEPGKGTREDVRRTLGEPSYVRPTEDGEDWVYLDVDNHYVEVSFTKSGVVKQEPYTKENPPGPSNPCFVATVVYGSKQCEEVSVLQQFRDTVLLKSAAGRLFVRCYYWLAPPVALWLQDKPSMKRLAKSLLNLAVRLAKPRSHCRSDKGGEVTWKAR